MIKRILVALDPDLDTPIAVRYAIDLAKRHDAQVNGLAVVDLGSIERSTRGGGIGSFYYAEKLQEKLTEESRLKARDLIAQFENAVAAAGVAYGEMLEEGVPFERIVEDMKYHDVLVMGKDPHFFYAHPKKETHTVARVVKRTVGPTLIVGQQYHRVERALIAYDGSDAAARAIRRFVHLVPFGLDVAVQLVTVDKNAGEAELRLKLAAEYIEAHGFEVNAVHLDDGKPGNALVEHAAAVGADLIVAGSHSVNAIKRIAFGSTTAQLIKTCQVPLFLDN